MIGCEPTGIIGFGMLSEYSRIRVPSPPQKSTTFIGYPPAFIAVVSNALLNSRLAPLASLFRQSLRKWFSGIKHCASRAAGM
jgi:hypothetical protein